MNLVLIYGPPAAGKLTISKELASLTNYALLPHNSILALIQPLFNLKLSNPLIWEIYEEIKLSLIQNLEKQNKNVIITEVYDEKNYPAIKRLNSFLKALKDQRVKVFPIRITCSTHELYKRIEMKDRKSYKKIVSKEDLRKILKNGKLDFSIPFSYELDSTITPPIKLAWKILSFLDLGIK